MQSHPSLQTIRHSTISYAAGLVTTVVGILVLVGWQVDISWLKTPVPSTVTMKANTAISFLLCGIALIIAQRRTKAISHTVIVRICSSAVVALGLVVLSQDLFSWNLGIDQLLFTDHAAAVARSHPGRMAPTTAVNFILVGIALLLLDFRRGSMLHPSDALAIVPAMIALFGVLGYLYNVESFYRLKDFTAMAPHTAALFLVLSLGVLFSHKGNGFVEALLRSLQDSTDRTNHKVVVKGLLIVLVCYLLGVLIGWMYDIELLKRIHPAFVPMKPSGLLCFLFLTASLAIIVFTVKPLLQFRLHYVFTAVAFVIALLSLLENIFEIDVLVSRLLFAAQYNDPRFAVPGRMPIAASISFMSVAAAMYLRCSSKHERFPVIFVLFLLLPLAITFLTLLSYLVDPNSLQRIASYALIPLAASLAFLIVIPAVYFSTEKQAVYAFDIKRQFYYWLVPIVSVALLIGYLAFRITAQQAESSRWTKHTFVVQNKLRDLEAEIINLQRSDFGLILSGQQSYLNDFAKSLAEIYSLDSTINSLVQGDSRQVGTMKEVDELITERIEFSKRQRAVFEKQGLVGISKVVGEGEGNEMLHQIRKRINEMLSVEDRLVQERDEISKQDTAMLRYVLLLGSILGSVMAVVLLRFVRSDIVQREQTERLITGQRNFVQNILDTVQDSLLVLNEDLTVSTANRSFYETFQLSPDSTLNRYIHQLGAGQWNIPRLNELLEDAITSNKTFTGLEVDHTSHEIGRKIMRLSGTKLLGSGNDTISVLLVIEDITDWKKAEEALRQLNQDLDDRVAERTALLRNSEQRFRTTLDNLMEGCHLLGFDWRYLYLNGAADKHNRRPKEELLGNRYMDMWRGIEATTVFASIKQCMEERIAYHIENQFVFPDGTTGWFDLSIQPVPEGVFILSMDITERKQAAKEIQKQAARTESLLHIAELLNAQLDLDSVLTTVCQEAAKGLHAPASFINLYDPSRSLLVFSGMFGLPDEFGEQYIAPSHELLKEYVARMGQLFVIQDVQALADPKVPNLELYRSVNARTIANAVVQRFGELIGVLSMVTFAEERQFNGDELALLKGIADQAAQAISNARLHKAVQNELAERKRAEEELNKHREHLEELVEERTKAVKESEEKFRNVFENSPIGKSLTRLDGKVHVNRAFADMLGYSVEDLSTQNWKEITHPNDIEESQNVVASLIAGKSTSARYQKRYLHRNGSIVWADVSTFLQKDEKGKALFFITSISDITERKQAEENLRQANAKLETANKELEAFSYSVSHDLRGPLRHVSGFVDLLQKHAGATLDEKGMRYLSTITDSVNQMGVLIDDLLSFSRMGRVEIQTASVYPTPLVKEVVHRLGTDAKGRTVEWRIELLPEVIGDPSMLRQVFENLLSNALKYTRTREKAIIEIGAQQAVHETVFFVRDNGVGFDMQYKDKLFGVFQRLHSSRDFEGTGIGLANVRRIITRHGGRTWAEGSVGEGATFYFSLPKP